MGSLRHRGAFALVVLGAVFAPRLADAQAGIPYLAEPDGKPKAEEKPKLEKQKGKAKGKAALAPALAPVAAPVKAAEPVAAPSAAPAAVPGPGEAPPMPPVPEAAEPEQSPGRPMSALLALWNDRRAAQQANDARKADDLLQALVTQKRDAGWPDVFVFGDALTRESQAALAAGNPKQALVLAEAAVQLAPDRPGAHVQLSDARFAAGAGVGPALSALWHSVAVSFSEPPLLRLRFGNWSLALAFAALCAASAMALAVLFRQARMLCHDLVHLFPRGATGWQALILILFVVLVPVFLHWGVAWMIPVTLIVFALYYDWRERLGAVVALLLLAGVAAALPQVTSHLAYAGSRSQDVYLAVRDAGAEDAARRILSRDDRTPEELFALGLRARYSGDVPKAREWLNRSIGMQVHSDELVTLGNVAFLSGDRPGAVAAYERAARENSEDVVALFNLSRAYFAMTEHQKAGDAHRRAMAIDYDRVEAFNNDAKRLGKGYVVEQGVPMRLLNVPLEYSKQHNEAVRELWAPVAGNSSRMVFALVLLGAALVVVAAFILRGIVLPAVPCSRCGEPSCLRCAPSMPNQEQCHNCYRAFVQPSGADPQLRIQKEIAGHRHKARRARVRQALAVLMAGSAQLARGASARGLVLLAGFVASGLCLMTALDLVPDLAGDAANGSRWLAVVGSGGVALVFYIVGLVDGLKDN